ncbi:MAG: hypothetical protein HYT87_12930 [Nitrospirae bacterium]|nr:hypothetical protein [Nitrospirota bacterium]
MPTIVLRTTSTDEHFNGDCDYGAVEMATPLVTLCLRRIGRLRKAKKGDPDLFEMYYWDQSVVFFSWSDDLIEREDTEFEDEVDRVLADQGVYVSRTRIQIPEQHIQRVECVQMVVRDDAVAWTAIPKHSDVYVTTHEISVQQLREMAAAGGSVAEAQGRSSGTAAAEVR